MTTDNRTDMAKAMLAKLKAMRDMNMASMKKD
jgi:hypothetical protein